MLQVLDNNVVDDQPVEEAQVDAAHAHFCAQLAADGTGHHLPQPPLHERQLYDNDQRDIEAQQTPYRPADDVLEFLHFACKDTLFPSKNKTFSFSDMLIPGKSSNFAAYNH